MASSALAETVTGIVRDQTGGALPGVTVEARRAERPAPGVQARTNYAPAISTVSDISGAYRLDLPAGPYDLSFTLPNFAPAARSIVVAGHLLPVNIVMQLALNADVTVTGKRTFANLAD